MTGFLDGYEPVEARLARFWDEHPTGRVETELLAFDAGSGSYIVKAAVWRQESDPLPASTGLAQETVSTRGVNSTSALENCETSALGRALANLNYAPKGARPSREEMAKARPESDPDTVAELRRAVDATLSLETLRVIWTDAVAANKAGRLSNADWAALQTRIGEVRAALGGDA